MIPDGPGVLGSVRLGGTWRVPVGVAMQRGGCGHPYRYSDAFAAVA